MVRKKILLVNKEGDQRCLEKRTNGSLWQGGKELFAYDPQASEKGRKVDAVKTVWNPLMERRDV